MLGFSYHIRPLQFSPGRGCCIVSWPRKCQLCAGVQCQPPGPVMYPSYSTMQARGFGRQNTAQCGIFQGLGRLVCTSAHGSSRRCMRMNHEELPKTAHADQDVHVWSVLLTCMRPRSMAFSDPFVPERRHTGVASRRTPPCPRRLCNAGETVVSNRIVGSLPKSIVGFANNLTPFATHVYVCVHGDTADNRVCAVPSPPLCSTAFFVMVLVLRPLGVHPRKCLTARLGPGIVVAPRSRVTTCFRPAMHLRSHAGSLNSARAQSTLFCGDYADSARLNHTAPCDATTNASPQSC